jgi:hypothetical protein
VIVEPLEELVNAFGGRQNLPAIAPFAQNNNFLFNLIQRPNSALQREESSCRDWKSRGYSEEARFHRKLKQSSPREAVEPQGADQLLCCESVRSLYLPTQQAGKRRGFYAKSTSQGGETQVALAQESAQTLSGGLM